MLLLQHRQQFVRVQLLGVRKSHTQQVRERIVTIGHNVPKITQRNNVADHQRVPLLDLKEMKPDTELTVTPRPAGFSDQGGNGVWSLDIDRKGDRLHVSKYEFITYGRNFEQIKEKLEELAGEGELSEKAAERADFLKRNLDTLQLQLVYYGPQDKPYYALTLSVLPVPQLASNPFHPNIQIKEDEAGRIVDHLSKEGFFDQAVKPKSGQKQQPVRGYTLTVSVKGMTLRLDGT